MRTDRLDLVAATLELCDAEATGRSALAAALRARVPDAWPPPVFEADDVERVRDQLRAHPELAAWTLYYVLQRPTPRTSATSLIGIAGFVGPPTSDGVVEIGYAILPDYQRQGYATEAVNALINHAFADPRVRRITATTYETLAPSIGVLRKTGFVAVAGPDATGIIRFERSRAGAPPSTA
jgi:RimJ/RimL family protein N-acetyltransferase